VFGSVGATTGNFQEHYQQQRKFIISVRSRYANVVTTLNQVLGCRNTEAMFTRGSYLGKAFFFYAE
jgi:hypothetical protein